MTCIAVKIEPKKITIAGDTQTTWGRNKFPKKDYIDNQLKADGKIFQTNGMTLGCAGSSAQIGLFQIFCKTHKPKEMEKDPIMEWFMEFREWINSKAKVGFTELSLHAILISNNKVFCVFDFMDIWEVKSFDAVGSGMWLAIGAMDNGVDAEKAIETAIKYDLYCGGKITKIEIKK